MERARVGVSIVFQQFNLFARLAAAQNIAGPLRWVHGLDKRKPPVRIAIPTRASLGSPRTGSHSPGRFKPTHENS